MHNNLIHSRLGLLQSSPVQPSQLGHVISNYNYVEFFTTRDSQSIYISHFPKQMNSIRD